MDDTERGSGTGTIAAMFAIVAFLMIIAFVAWQLGHLDP